MPMATTIEKSFQMACTVTDKLKLSSCVLLYPRLCFKLLLASTCLLATFVCQHRRRKILKVGGAEHTVARAARAKIFRPHPFGSNHANFRTIEGAVTEQPGVSR